MALSEPSGPVAFPTSYHWACQNKSPEAHAHPKGDTDGGKQLRLFKRFVLLSTHHSQRSHPFLTTHATRHPILRHMHPLRHFFVLLAVLAASVANAADEPLKMVPVANYVNRPDITEKDGARAAAILKEHKILAISAGSAGMTMSVPAHQAAEARILLAKAIQNEGLRLTLVEPTIKGGRSNIVTPESILEAAPPTKPERKK
jgi:hypothetical protein